jgi:hypothetical protein
MRRHFLAAALFVLAAAFMFAEDDISPDIQPDTLQLPSAETKTASESAPEAELAPEEKTLTDAETPPETETLPKAEALSDGKRSGGKRAPPISVGLGLELNNNNRHGAAAGISAAADWRISPFLAAGLRAGFSSNFGYSDTLEGEGFARLILPVKTPLRGWDLELFAQGGMGISQIFAHEWASYSLLAGGGLGARFLKKSFFIEAIVRAGAPFLWAAGVSAGYRFGTGNGQ